MRAVYQHYQILYENTDEREKHMMRQIAGRLFGDLNLILMEYIVLQVCKITDPAKQGKYENHTIAFLLDRCDFGDDRAIVTRLHGLHENLLRFRTKLLDARNKLISHRDREAIIAGEALGGAHDEE
jgi:hypothetical protein